MSLNMMKSLKTAVAAAVLFTAGVANAGVYQFNLTGDYTASWQLDTGIAPDVASEGEGFIYYDIAGNFPGSLFGITDVTFYHEDIGGGFEIYDYWGDNYLVVTDGTQLYTGSEDSPTFLTGTFNLTEYLGTGSYVLTVTDLDAGPTDPTDPVDPPVDVPEPASIAMLLGGLGMMYASKRRQSK